MKHEVVQSRFMGVSFLVLINLSVMTSLRNLPLVAEYGYGSLFFYAVVAAVFLFPSALVSAELATGWNTTGGIYVWVKEAFGPGWGFFAVWMQWIHNVTWFPAILAFSATATAYLISPELANNKFYLIGFILVGFWGCTLFNYFGSKTSSLFSALGVLAGTVLPGLLLIGFAIVWIVQGNPLQIEFSPSSLIPDLGNVQHLVFIAGLFLAFGGLEVSAAHARDVANPQKTFPRAILIAALVSFLLYAVGALSIALMIPQQEISLVAGLMQAFEFLFNWCNMGWLLIPLGLMIVLGAVGELNAWIIGPVRALHATSLHGNLPKIFQKVNQHKVPVNILLFQGGIVTLSSFVFFIMPSTSSGFWILSAMSVQLYLIMYILMFLAAIKLRYSHPHVVRPYQIPFKMYGIWGVGSIGVLSSLFGFCIGFVPPSQLPMGGLIFYESFLGLGIGLMCLIPGAIYLYTKKNRANLAVELDHKSSVT